MVGPLSGGVEFILQKSVLCCVAAWVTNECWCAPKLHGSRARLVIHSHRGDMLAPVLAPAKPDSYAYAPTAPVLYDILDGKIIEEGEI